MSARALRFAILGVVFAAAVTRRANADEYKLRDEARAAIALAINQHDAAAFAAHVGKQLRLTAMWFDTASCRRKFRNARVKPKDVPALVDCLAPLGMDAKTLLVRYGPDVTVSLKYEISDDQARLVAMDGDPLADPVHPEVWVDAFEGHRKEGAKTFALDAKARAELEAIGETGVVYRVCVDPAGKVASTRVLEVSPRGPTAKQVAAVVKSWRFEPFLVRGKPTTACATETMKLGG